MPPLVSVIIPLFNRFESVYEAIDSVINQNYRPIQLILVDDQSDKEFTLPSSYYQIDDFEIKLIRNNKNLGPGLSREAGRKFAKGKYIAFLDSDDLWHPDKLSEQVHQLEEDLELVMCYCATMEFYSSPNDEGNRLRKNNDKSFDKIIPTILNSRPWSTSSCLWRNDTICNTVVWLEFYNWEDLLFDFSVGCISNKISFINKTLCFKRQTYNGNQLSSISPSEALILKVGPIIEMFKVFKKSDLYSQKTIKKIFIYKMIKRPISELLQIMEVDSATALNKILFTSDNFVNFMWGIYYSFAILGLKLSKWKN